MKIPCSKIQRKIIIVASAVVAVDYQQMLRFDWPEINTKMAVGRLIVERSLVYLKLKNCKS
jgi:hypothetical protein